MISGGVSAGISSGGQTKYYSSAVGGGREGYYLDAVDAGEPVGQWFGKLAERSGLVGEVDGDVMEHVFGTLTTPAGEKLGSAPGKYLTADDKIEAWIEAHPEAMPHEIEAARAGFEKSTREAKLGFDLTYSAPKSVSTTEASLRRASQALSGSGRSSAAGSIGDRLEDRLLWVDRQVWGLIEDGEIRTRAVGEVHGSPRSVAGAGVLVAMFPQHTNRDGDPQWHIHHVIANRVLDEEGEIRAIDGQAMTIDMHGWSAFQDNLAAAELEEFGLPMVQRADGSWEVEFVSPELCDALSTRSQAVRGRTKVLKDRYVERHGHEPSPIALHMIKQHAALSTRQGKTHDGETLDQMVDRVDEKAKALLSTGLTPIGVRAVLAVEERDKARARGEKIAAEKWSAESVINGAVAAVAAKGATWHRGMLEREIIHRMPARLGEITPAERWQLFQELTDQALASEHVVKVAGHELIAGLGVRETEAKYAAAQSLAAEDALIRAAVERGGHTVDEKAAAEWLTEHRSWMSGEQREAVLRLATSDARMSMLIGPAGAGKSTVVGTVSEMYTDLSGGGRVHGVAVGQLATDNLTDDGVEVTANLSKWLDAQRAIEAGKATPEQRALMVTRLDHVFLDESSMVDRAQVDEMKHFIDKAGAKFTFAGDPAQLGSIGAGGVMGLVEGKVETHRLTEVRRFQEEWEGPASLRIRAGDASALNEYDRRGRLRAVESLEAGYEALGRGVAADLKEGQRSVAILGTNDEAGIVNAIVREHLVAAGVVEEAGVDLGEKRGGGVAGVGDLVMMRRNNRHIGVVNRETYEVTRADAFGLRVVNRETGEYRDLPGRYVGEHVSLAYGATRHATQGLTYDRSRSLFTGQEKSEAGYVPLTRGAEFNLAYVVCKADEEGNRPTPQAVMAKVVETPSEELAARVMLDQDMERLGSMATLAPHYEAVVRQACRNRLDEHLDQLVDAEILDPADRARLGSDTSMEHLSRRVRRLEICGKDPAEVIRAAVEGRSLATAKSPAQVLADRLGKLYGEPETTGKAAKPADLLPEDAARVDFLEERMDDRRSVLGRETADAAPAWAVRLLGEVPAAGTEARAAWEERAGEVAGYREATSWTDENRPMKERPSVYVTEQANAWEGAHTALGRPEEERAEAILSTGQLLNRHRAWEREKAWAPKFADHAQRNATQEAMKAREDAALAQDETTRKEREAEAAMWEDTARAQDAMATAYKAFVDHTRVTAELAERARVELEERGIVPGEEDDRTTAAEWLGIEESGLDDEDEVRNITEADLVREEPAAEPSWRAQEVEKAEPERTTPDPELITGRWATLDALSEQGVETQQRHTAWALDLIANRQSQEAQEPAAMEPEYDVDEFDQAQAAAVEQDAAELGGLGY